MRAEGEPEEERDRFWGWREEGTKKTGFGGRVVANKREEIKLVAKILRF